MCGCGVGFCYNFGCIVLVGFLVLVGWMGELLLFGMVFGIDVGIVYGFVVIVVWFLLEMCGCCLFDVVVGLGVDDDVCVGVLL